MVYLTDFGLARMAEMSASTMSQDMILGTPQYISPEQASGNKALDKRTDVYSFGVILYEMVVGRVPFNADTPYAIVHDHIYSELPRPSSINPAIPPAVEAVLIKTLSKNPADRYDSAGEVMNAFRSSAQQDQLVALDPDRQEKAEEAFANQPKALDDEPTITPLPSTPDVPGPLNIPNPPSPPGIPGPFPPGTPRRPTPPRPPSGHGKRVVIERSFDMGKQRPDIQVNMGDLPKRMEEGVRRVSQWGERMAAQIEEAAKEGAKNAAYNNVVSTQEAEEARIRKRIEKRYRERQGLLTHLIAFVVVNILLWGLWSSGLQQAAISAAQGAIHTPLPDVAQSALEIPWPLYVTFFWGIGMISHIISYYNKYGPGAQRREAEIEREIDRQRERSAAFEKPKNDQRRLELTDDGEIREAYDDDASRSQKQKRG